LRNSGRCCDCAASTASSISSSARLGAGLALARPLSPASRLASVVSLSRIGVRGYACLKMKIPANLQSTGQSQSESIALPATVAESSTLHLHLRLSLRPPEIRTFPLRRPASSHLPLLALTNAANFSVLHYLPRTADRLFRCPANSFPWHPTCLSYRGASPHSEEG
jgi:hypothetical protein